MSVKKFFVRSTSTQVEFCKLKAIIYISYLKCNFESIRALNNLFHGSRKFLSQITPSSQPASLNQSSIGLITPLPTIQYQRFSSYRIDIRQRRTLPGRKFFSWPYIASIHSSWSWYFSYVTRLCEVWQHWSHPPRT